MVIAGAGVEEQGAGAARQHIFNRACHFFPGGPDGFRG